MNKLQESRLPAVFAAGCLLVLAAITLPAANVEPSAGKPNTLILLSDDQGYADLGLQGSTDNATPNIDSLIRR